jgi:copper transport protein
LLVKIGLLAAALCLASVNLLRTKPQLARPEVGSGTATLLRRLVTGETILVAAAVFAAAVLSSLAPPSKALAAVGGAAARVGRGPVVHTVKKNGYTFDFTISPNKAAIPNSFAVKVTRNGQPVRHADVVVTVEMLDMLMTNQAYRMSETTPGVYSHAAPALVMVGHWGLSFNVAPRGQAPFNVLLVDKAEG